MRTLALQSLVLVAALVSALPSSASSLDPKFFANMEFQSQYPGAFALQKESAAFVDRAFSDMLSGGTWLIGVIRAEPSLHDAILRFPSLSQGERIETMKAVFALQTEATPFAAPLLVFDSEAPRAAFFEFNPKKPGAGRVILNPRKLFADPNPYAALLLLIHETRHSFQFQLAFSSPGLTDPGPLAFRTAFVAQRQIFDQGIKPSLCDFLTLNHEYDAFLFGNYVVEHLTYGAADTSQMGTLASQYEPEKGLRLDLRRLARAVGYAKLLDEFNELEKKQYEERNP